MSNQIKRNLPEIIIAIMIIVPMIIVIPSMYSRAKQNNAQRQIDRQDPEYGMYITWIKCQGTRFDNHNYKAPSFSEWKYMKRSNLLGK